MFCKKKGVEEMGMDSWLGMGNLLNLTHWSFKGKMDEHTYSCKNSSLRVY